MTRSVRWLAWFACLAPLAAQPVPLAEREVLALSVAHRFEFQGDAAAWQAAHDTVVAAAAGGLHIECTGSDPYVVGPRVAVLGPCQLRLRGRFATAGQAQVFWATATELQFAEARSVQFSVLHDGASHEYVVPLAATGTITALRLDPGSGPGTVVIEGLQVEHAERHPLEITGVSVMGNRVKVSVHNHGADWRSTTVLGAMLPLAPSTTGGVEFAAPAARFAELDIVVEAPELPRLVRTVHLVDSSEPVEAVRREFSELSLHIAKDGRGGWLEFGGDVVAMLYPLVARGGRALPLHLDASEEALRLTGDGVDLRLQLSLGQLAITLRSEQLCEGPVVRGIKALEQGLFCGLEFLGAGEPSSSRIDVETAAHLRFAPDPKLVTLPLLAVVSPSEYVALGWDDPALQPTFATPNFVDGTPDHRMSLRGTRIDAVVCVGVGNLDTAILGAIERRGGLPPLPAAPRDAAAQQALCLAALRGPLAGEGGFGHCAEVEWGRAPFADFASTLWHLTGELPALERLEPGGADLRNDAAYLVSGRGLEWFDRRSAEALALLAEQGEDGAFRCSGPLRAGHFEDTASGYCAERAAQLLEWGLASGDTRVVAGGLKALQFLSRFRTPRGAQTWEVPLHTPDLLAAAHLVRAHLLGYQLTQRRGLLDAARAWAIRGLPFVYLWDPVPGASYATVPVYGATHRRAPVWFGTPVPWCGLVYARALVGLAAYDQTLPWSQVARGILLAAQRMQYADGPVAGCLPDVFDLTTRQGAGPSINPCALVSLERTLAGKLDGLCMVTGSGRRVVAPHPVRLGLGEAIITAPVGASYQVLVDGARWFEITRSAGEDRVSLR